MSEASAPPAGGITLEQLRAEIGRTRTSSWFTIDQDRIDKFADVTEDRNFFHVDAERARAETPFGGTIAHGFLTLSMLSAMYLETMPVLQGSRASVNYGFDRIRFLNIVKSGARVRAHFKTVEVIAKTPVNILVRTRVNVEIEGQKRPALVADWLGLSIIEDQRGSNPPLQGRGNS